MSDDCPGCETDLLVAEARTRNYAWVCHGCDTRFGAVETQPIAYDDVDEWVEVWSADANRLHADPDCPPGECSTATHAPDEAREHRYSRCLACGHEVVES